MISKSEQGYGKWKEITNMSGDERAQLREELGIKASIRHMTGRLADARSEGAVSDLRAKTDQRRETHRNRSARKEPVSEPKPNHKIAFIGDNPFRSSTRWSDHAKAGQGGDPRKNPAHKPPDTPQGRRPVPPRNRPPSGSSSRNAPQRPAQRRQRTRPPQRGQTAVPQPAVQHPYEGVDASVQRVFGGSRRMKIGDALRGLDNYVQEQSGERKPPSAGTEPPNPGQNATNAEKKTYARLKEAWDKKAAAEAHYNAPGAATSRRVKGAQKVASGAGKAVNSRVKNAGKLGLDSYLTSPTVRRAVNAGALGAGAFVTGSVRRGRKQRKAQKEIAARPWKAFKPKGGSKKLAVGAAVAGLGGAAAYKVGQHDRGN